MFLNSRLHKIVVPLTALVAVLAFACHAAQAQVKPFKITGEGEAEFGVPLPGPETRPHTIVGNATHLGRHTGTGSVQTNTAVFHSDGSITGEFESGSPFVFEGANGDILSCNYGRVGASTQGTFLLVPVSTPGMGEWYVAFWIAEFVPNADCTGKFAGVTGSWVMYAMSEPFQLGSSDRLYYSWQGDGSLTFKN